MPHEERRPEGAAPRTDGEKVTPRLPLTGCSCGCLHGVDCITDHPAPDRDGHCCGPYALDQLAKGLGCPVHGRRPS